ncbi:hypothetical protein LTR56_009445 [Elasticomyces elasticus]|nr:hypothetical protein LTR56_009445 [Elasticomyces elasticus]KAK3645877.1 hypothetical protein LTR22_014543 [Elasticomyces elasticus]KAK5765502.1 hypothetical protein LTS12_004253 [Elasticomyces elasticus]
MASAQKSSRQEWQISERLPLSITQNNAGFSRLMDLPAELRNTIWEYVMSVDTVYVQLDRKNEQLRAFILNHDPSESADDRSLKLVRSTVGVRDDAERPAGHECLSLLRCCKKIYEEAKQLFYVLNSFEVQAFNATSHLNEQQMLVPGIFVNDAEDTPMIASAMVELINTIGDRNAGVMTNVTFHVGQIDEDDFEHGANALVAMRHIVDCLRPIYTSRPSWRFAVGMTLLVAPYREHSSEAERMEVVLNPQDIRQSTEAAVAAVVNRDSRGDLDDGLQADFIKFLDGLQDLKWS